MTGGRLSFDRFLLDPGQRQLRRDGAPVDLNNRYFDALLLLTAHAGELVSKDRFLDEVWRGVPVTDEALSQCIKSLRRLLGDDAAKPRFIETVPKHGYRFVAAVEAVETVPVGRAAVASQSKARRVALGWGAGTLGAGIAGLIGGLGYGLAIASQPGSAGSGALSIVLLLLWLTVATALIGGAGVSLGIALADVMDDRRWRIMGGAIGGLVVGVLGKLIGLDAFNLLFGRSPEGITGGAEGLMLGTVVGLAAWATDRQGWDLRRTTCVAVAIGLAGGTATALAGGRLMGSSLALLAQSFPASRIRLDGIGLMLGEQGFGPISRTISGALEAALFAGCIVAARVAARRQFTRD